MGHKRYGYLKKTKAWRLIVNELGGFALGTSEISSIAQKTLQNVQGKYSKLKNDPSINAGFEFLIVFPTVELVFVNISYYRHYR